MDIRDRGFNKVIKISNIGKLLLNIDKVMYFTRVISLI